MIPRDLGPAHDRRRCRVCRAGRRAVVDVWLVLLLGVLLALLLGAWFLPRA